MAWRWFCERRCIGTVGDVYVQTAWPRLSKPAKVRQTRTQAGMVFGLARAVALSVGLALTVLTPAAAVVIELKDVASDRVERQRAEAIGQLPLPGTPNISQLAERLAAKKMAAGNHMLIRVFKASSELEVWLKSGDRYELFSTYPVCNWSGTLGPKLNEGDKQSPEGVYTVTSQQLHLIGRHPRSLNLGFPNALDRQMSRTGSYILIHGGCGSVGCFAMTNPVIEEVFSLASAALNKGGQDAVQVHAFPFRMTEERLKAYSLNEWYDFWRNLKDVSDSFERTRQPPRITVCEGRYWVEDSAQEVASQGPLAVCAVSLVEAASLSGPDDASQAVGQPWWPQRAMVPPSLVPSRPQAPMVHSPRERLSTVLSLARFSVPRSLPIPKKADGLSSASLPPRTTTKVTTSQPEKQFAGLVQPSKLVDLMPTTHCNLNLASCRLWVAKQRLIMLARVAAERVQALKRIAAARRY
jgi:murein L,D-transpeptidase YafK